MKAWLAEQFQHQWISSAIASFPGAKVDLGYFETETEGPLGKLVIQMPAWQAERDVKIFSQQ